MEEVPWRKWHNGNLLNLHCDAVLFSRVVDPLSIVLAAGKAEKGASPENEWVMDFDSWRFCCDFQVKSCSPPRQNRLLTSLSPPTRPDNFNTMLALSVRLSIIPIFPLRHHRIHPST
jgi:hypothetical protein